MLGFFFLQTVINQTHFSLHCFVPYFVVKLVAKALAHPEHASVVDSTQGESVKIILTRGVEQNYNPIKSNPKADSGIHWVLGFRPIVGAKPGV